MRSQGWICRQGENPLFALTQSLESERYLHDILIIFPTARLGQAFLDQLTQKHPCIRPPAVSTLDQWVWTLAKTPTTPIDSQVEELLLTSLLQHTDYKYLLPQHAHELRQLFHDLSIHDKDEQISHIHQLFIDDHYHDPKYTKSLSERLNEIVDLQEKFKKILDNKNALTTARAMKQTVAEALRHPLPGFRKVFIAGLTTVNRALLPLLRSLCEDSKTTLILPPAPVKRTGRNPIRELYDNLGFIDGTKHDTQSEQPQTNTTVIVRAKDALHEVFFALRTAQKQIEEGCPPHQIGIVVANEKSYSKIFETLLKESAFADITTNNSLPTPFQHTGFGSWVLEIGRLLTTKQSWQHLCDLMTHPWRDLAIPIDIPAADIRAELNSLNIDPERHGFGAFLEQLPPNLQAAYLSVQAYIQPLLDLKGSKILSQWSEFFLDFFSEEKHPLLTPLDQSSLEAFQKCLRQFSEASYFHDASVSVSTFWHSMTRSLSSLEAREAGFSLEGVQILGIPEARCIPFHTTIVIGCTEGSFPRSVPNDDLIDDWLKTKIGVEGWEYVEALEDTTFHLLSSLSKNFIMTYPKSSSHGEGVRSRFIEALSRMPRTQFIDAPEIPSSPMLENMSRSSHKDIGLASTHISQTMSATRLRSFIQCPYRFLLQTLSVPGKKIQKNILEGQWLHKVLEHFFTGFEDKVLPLQKSETKPELMTRLITLTLELGPSNIINSSLGLHLQYHSWPRWVDHIFPRLHFDMMTEKKIEGRPTSIGDETWSLHGAIDHLQIDSSLNIIYDFKRQYQPSLKEVSSGLEPQLPFYALAFHTDNLKQMITGYWSILKGTWEPRGVGEDSKLLAKDLGLVSTATPDLESQVKTIQKLWLLRQTETRNLAFKPDVGPWCERCDYAGICRKNDPDYNLDFEKNKRMEPYQENL